MSESREHGRLGTIAVIVAIVSGLAAAVGVGWTILHQESTEVADYRKLVVAACERVQGINRTDIGAVTDISTFRIVRSRVLRVLRSNLDESHHAFDEFNDIAVPSELAGEHAAALAAQEGWYAAMDEIIARVRDRMAREATLDQFNRLGIEFAGSRGADTTLNGAMSALAGQTCHPIGT